MRVMARRFRHENSGATAIEYAILTFLVGVAAVVGISYAGAGANTTFCSVAGAIGAGCGQAAAAPTPAPATGPACSVVTAGQPYMPAGSSLMFQSQSCSASGASTPTVVTVTGMDTSNSNDGTVTFYASGGWVALAEAGAQTTALESECKAGSGPTSLLSGFANGNPSAIESVPASGFSQGPGEPSFIAADVTKTGTTGTQPSGGSFVPQSGTPIPSQSSTPATTGQQYVTCAP